jgi:uncharacterized protein (TIGR01777 family)
MTLFLSFLTVQALVGALDNLLHHEITEKLPRHASARTELALHAARELIYAGIFLIVAWLAPHGLLAWALLGVLLIEVAITMADFIEEDRTRTLPPFERTLHTFLAVNFGVVLCLAAPLWAAWAREPTGFAFEPRGLFSAFFTLCAFGVGAWGVRNVIASAGLFAKARLSAIAPRPARGRTLLVTGATGFLGEDLVRRRLADGDAVIVLTRDPRRAEALFGAGVLAVRDLAQIPAGTRIDVIVNLAGAGVSNGLWTRARKRVLLQSRLKTTQAVNALIARLDAKPRVLVSASAVGFYGDRGEELLTEHAARGRGFTADLCAAWEHEALRAGALAGGAPRVALLRFGLILGRHGGAWPLMTMSLPFGLGASFGDGRQWMAWIHKQDALRLIEAALEDGRLAGPINAVAPQETRHGEVMRAAAEIAGCKLLIPAPAFALRLALGEMSALFLDSQRVIPRAAGAAGFQFKFATIEAAARDLMGRRERRHAPPVASLG